MKSQQDFDKKLIEIELALLLDSKPEITRAHRLLRPKTMAYWTDIFPHLNDESEYNNFKSHFRILRSTFNQLLSILHHILIMRLHLFNLKFLLKFRLAL